MTFWNRKPDEPNHWNKRPMVVNKKPAAKAKEEGEEE